jgi:hypothetical protein
MIKIGAKNQNGKYLIIEEYKPKAALTFGKRLAKTAVLLMPS